MRRYWPVPAEKVRAWMEVECEGSRMIGVLGKRAEGMLGDGF